MAETAKILNPNKLVLYRIWRGGCSLADSCPPKAFAAFKAAHPDHLVISTSTAPPKLSDERYICTSSNAVHIVRQIPEEQLIFLPRSEFGAICNGADWTRLVLWQRYCA